MGWPPAVVIVVRHGARLDAADKQWHLTSPTPYDPPLTYGGWTQSRALGARIASILRSRETDDDIPAAGEADTSPGDRRKRRHKVIIHTSPFLRCVQTSIAISSGLAQNPGHIHTSSRHRPASSQGSICKASQLYSSSPKLRPSILTGSPSLAPIPEPTNGEPYQQSDNIKKAMIRVDAFLGEWLTPDYFELITPPPSSIMMVAGAKADLLRKEDYNNLIHIKDVTGGVKFKAFPGGWGSPTAAPSSPTVGAVKEKEEGPLSSLSSLAQALPGGPGRERTSSLGSAATSGNHRVLRGRSPSSMPLASEHGIYQPPIPSYAISNSDPIPPGYVAHSRDACVDVDYQWDSMRDPQRWGTGGEYGEEWSAMHKRFRNGLQHMVSWYQNADEPGKLLPKGPTKDEEPSAEDLEHENEDLVIILVTHGAGCNALIGALTNQPVLLDVGMASLTMAMRKPAPPSSPTTTSSHSRNSSRSVSLSDQYDVKLVANTEHLRSTSSTPSSSRAPSVSGTSTFQERYITSNRPFDPNKARSATTSSSLGSVRRTASIASSQPRSYQPTRQSSIGLWSAAAREEEKREKEKPEDEMIMNFGNDENTPPSEPANIEELHEADNEKGKKRDEEDDVSPLGLWGAPKHAHTDMIRDFAPKRRWTVNERAQ